MEETEDTWMSITDGADPHTSRPPAESGEVSTAVALKRAVMGFVVLTGAMSLLGGATMVLVRGGAIGDAEADLLSWVAQNRIDVFDSMATVGSTLSDTWTIIGVVVGAVTMLWAAGRVRHAAMVLLAVLLEFASFLAVGAIVGRSRPDVEALHSVPSTPSFPSGHVAAAFVLYGSLVLVARTLQNRRVPFVTWSAPLVIALVVAAARVYEGVHNPTDVAAGLLLGMGALAVAGYATGIVDRPRPGGSDRSEW